MKHLFLSFIVIACLVLTGCKNLTNLSNLVEQQEITYLPEQKQEFEIIDEQIIVPIAVNGEEQKWIFDTHAANTLFFEEGSWTDTLTRHPLPAIAIQRDGAGNSFDCAMVVFNSMECNLFQINNAALSGIAQILSCSDINGILGGTNFGKNEPPQIVKIDFDDNYMELLKESPSESWRSVKSKFDFLGNIGVYLQIEGKERKFGFDTGFSSDISLLVKNKKEVQSLPTKKVAYGEVYQVAGGIVRDSVETKTAKNIVVCGTDLQVSESDIALVPNNMYNLVGMEFIQNFNWILDYKNKKVYLQERKTPYVKTAAGFYSNPEILGVSISFASAPVKVKTLVRDGKAEKSGLKLDDVVLKVNGVELSEIPPCERSKKVKEIILSSETAVFEVERAGEIHQILIR